MVIHDVESWVNRIIEQIRNYRPYLDESVRAVQAAILTQLSTKQLKYEMQEGQDRIHFSDKKGIVNEWLVRLDPDYPTQQMTETEKVVETYLLNWLVTFSPHFPVIPNKKFHSSDGLLIRVDKATAWIDGIIEIKTTGFSKDLERQLHGILEDLGFLVWLMNRNLDNSRRIVGKKPELPAIGQVSWPKKIKNIKLNPEYQKILYLSADREVMKGEIRDWQIQRSRFNIDEVARITALVWDSLAAQGGAAVAIKEEPMAIHRSPREGSTEEWDKVPKEAKNVTNQTTETQCKVLENGQPCLTPLPTDREPYYVDKEQKIPGCDKHAVVNVNDQVSEVASGIRLALEETRKLDPNWDPTEVAQEAQGQFNKIRTTYLPERAFTLCVSIARDARSQVYFACIERLVLLARENTKLHQGQPFADLVLARVVEIEQSLARLQRANARTKRAEAWELYKTAKSWAETSGKLSEVIDNLKQIDELISKSEEAVKPHLSNDMGLTISNQIRVLRDNRAELDRPDFYRSRQDPLLRSQQLVKAGKYLLERASTIETALNRGAEFEKLLDQKSWDLGYGDAETETESPYLITIGEVLSNLDAVYAAVAADVEEPETPTETNTEVEISSEEEETETSVEPAMPVSPAAALPEVEKPRFCNECGIKNKSGAKFCSDCGQPL